MSFKRRLEGKVAVVTGAASGIGEATAKLFAENGAWVVIADIQDEMGLQVAASIGEDRASYKHCDVRDERQVEEAVAYALEKYGSLHIMHSNAGAMGPLAPIVEMKMEEFDEAMAVNLRGSALAIKHAARAMLSRQVGGSIICTASLSSTLGGSGPAAYTASKHGVLGLVRSAASELGKHGIRVNCVSPFGVATPMASLVNGSNPAAIEAATSAMSNLKGIVLKPQHVAEAALFLASEESLFVSGHNLVVDGGYSVVTNIMAMARR